MEGSVSDARFARLLLMQLQELLEEDAQLGDMVREMEEAQTVQFNKEMTLASNWSLAEGNLLYQHQPDAQKARLTQKFQELQVLFEAYQIKKTKLDKQSNSASLETLLALLQAEGAKIEEDTENMAGKFLDGELPLDAFIMSPRASRSWHTCEVSKWKSSGAGAEGTETTTGWGPHYHPGCLSHHLLQPFPIPLWRPLGSLLWCLGASSHLHPPVPAGHIPIPFTAAMDSG